MPNYVMLNQPNKLEWLEKLGNQTGNFLWQMQMAQQAQAMRSAEAQKQREYEDKKLDANLDLQLGLHGFQTVPEGDAAQPGDMKIGSRLVRRGKPQLLKYGDKEFVYTADGKLTPIKDEEETKDTAAIRTFESVHFGGPAPEKRGTEEYRKLWQKDHESKAIRIGMEEKVETQEAMKDVDRRSFLQTAAWDKQVADVTRTKFDKDQWADMPVWKREEEIFNTANMDMKTVYKDWNPYFGDKNGVQGWYGKNPKTGKFELIKRWGKEKEVAVPKNTPSSRQYK